MGRAEGRVFDEILGSWSRFLLCGIYASCTPLQDSIIMVLLSSLRYCCGTISRQTPSFGSHRSQCLGKIYRSILLLSASLSKQQHVDKLLREVHDLLNKAQHGNHQTEIEIFLQWAMIPLNSGQLDSHACSTLHCNALSRLALPITETTPESLFEMQGQLYSRSLSLLSSLTQHESLNTVATPHVQRALGGERQFLILAHSFHEIKLLLR
jgi:hypothetical protein